MDFIGLEIKTSVRNENGWKMEREQGSQRDLIG
jgi:hypothetical protein